MMRQACAAFFLAATCSLSVSQAETSTARFTDLDAKFAKRGEMSFDDLTVLRNQYKSIVNSGHLNDSEKIYAVTQMGRIDLYRGGLLPEITAIDTEKQKAAMDDCLTDIELIATTDQAPYHYFKLACIGFRGKLESFLGRVKYGLMMRRAQGPALAAAERAGGQFEGGGIYRVMSAIRGNRKAKPLGLYNADEAFTYAEKALAAPAQVYAPFSHELSGRDFFENHYYQLQAKIARGIDHDDLNLVKEGANGLGATVVKIDFLNRLNQLGERKAEALTYRVLMTQLKGQADACTQQANWKACLVEKLSE